MQALTDNPSLMALGVLILALLVALGILLTRRGTHTGPGPDTRVQRALTASEVERHAIRHSRVTPVVVRTQLDIPAVPPPRPAFYEQLRRNADAREALTTELQALTPEQVEADRRALLGVVQPPALVSTGHRSLLEMTVPELMAQIEADAKTALIPKLNGAAVLPDLPDRRIHATLPDGSEVVRYERAGKWFHEGPGLRVRLTLGQAALLATSRGALIRHGLPGGGLFDLRVKKAREEQS